MLHGWQCLLAMGQSLPAPKISESIIFFTPSTPNPRCSFKWVGKTCRRS